MDSSTTTTTFGLWAAGGGGLTAPLRFRAASTASKSFAWCVIASSPARLMSTPPSTLGDSAADTASEARHPRRWRVPERFGGKQAAAALYFEVSVHHTTKKRNNPTYARNLKYIEQHSVGGARAKPRQRFSRPTPQKKYHFCGTVSTLLRCVLRPKTFPAGIQQSSHRPLPIAPCRPRRACSSGPWPPRRSSFAAGAVKTITMTATRGRQERTVKTRERDTHETPGLMPEAKRSTGISTRDNTLA